MILSIHEYDSLELVGRLEVDDATGSLSFLDGPNSLKEFAETNRPGFIRDTTVIQDGAAYAVTKIPLPQEPRFELLVNRTLMGKRWCSAWMAEAIKTTPAFSSHPWRLAHQS